MPLLDIELVVLVVLLDCELGVFVVVVVVGAGPELFCEELVPEFEAPVLVDGLPPPEVVDEPGLVEADTPPWGVCVLPVLGVVCVAPLVVPGIVWEFAAPVLPAVVGPAFVAGAVPAVGAEFEAFGALPLFGVAGDWPAFEVDVLGPDGAGPGFDADVFGVEPLAGSAGPVGDEELGKLPFA